MPPKNIENIPGMHFYVVDKDENVIGSVGKIDSIDIETEENCLYADEPPIILSARSYEVSFTTNRIGLKQFLAIITGKKITNNWLKMHGYRMVRTDRRKKRRRK